MSHLSSVDVGQSDLDKGGCTEASHAASTHVQSNSLSAWHQVKPNLNHVTWVAKQTSWSQGH